MAFTSQVIAQDEATPASLYNDAVASLKAKEWHKGYDLLLQALDAADPEEDEQIVSLANKNLGIASYYAGNDDRKGDELDAALEKYNKGIEVSPGFYANYIGKAMVLNEQGDDAGALSAYIKASNAAEKGGKADKAVELKDKATIFVSRAYSAKEWDKTLELANMFNENGESEDVYYYMSRAYKGKGDHQSALDFATKAIELGGEGKDGRNYFAQAEAYEELGNTSAALEAYKKVPAGTYAETAKYKLDQLANN